MAQVTYRGVKYDTNAKKESNSTENELVYRGHKYVKSLTNSVKG